MSTGSGAGAGSGSAGGGNAGAGASGNAGNANAGNANNNAAGQNNTAQNNSQTQQTQTDAATIAAQSNEQNATPGTEAPLSLSDYTKKHLSELYEGEEFADEDSIRKGFDRFVTDHKTATEKLKKYSDADKITSEAIAKHPELASIITDTIKNGDLLPVAIARHLGPEALTLNEGDEGFEQLQQVIAERRDNETNRQKRMDALKANQEKTIEVLKKFSADTFGEDAETQKNFFGWVDSSLSSMLEGNITPELMQKLYQGFSYEADIKEAADIAKIAGRNENIETTKMTTPKTKQGDGMPDLSGANNKKKENSLDSVLAAVAPPKWNRL